MDEVHRSVWSDQEIDLIVADYFSMLADELAGHPYSKSQHNEALQAIIKRSRKSIEFKHCNVSAVLARLGIQPIPGYKPMPHFQNSLIDGVERYLGAKGEPILSFAESAPPKVAETAALWVGPPPEVLPADQKETERLKQLVRKFDPAARDARNRKLGKQGEGLVFAHEQQRLVIAGRDDLAKKVEWTSEVLGDGAGFDIRSFTNDGKERLIEVKTTNGPAMTPFFISENERAFSEERADAFRLLRLYSFAEKPSAFELRPPLTESLFLRAANYRASFI